MAKNGFVRQQGFSYKILNTWVGALLLTLIAVGFGYLMATQMILGIGVLGLFLALFILGLCIYNAEAGIYITFAFTFVFCDIGRMIFTNGDVQLGLVPDVLMLATFSGLFSQKARLRESVNAFFKAPVVTWTLVLFGYSLVQVANPFAHSVEGWVQGARRVLENLVFLFILFHVFNSWEKTRSMLKVLFVLCLLAGIYACIQQKFGYFAFDKYFIMSSPTRMGLLFIGGDFRKFSSMSDPASFGMLMAAAAVFYIIIAIHQDKSYRKWVLIIGSLIMLMGMSYSGTRTANVMVAAGLAMFMLLSAHKRVAWVFGITCGVIFVVLLNLPIYSNRTLNRFRTSFQGTNDASFNVRELDRKMIQPYLLVHPIGGGFGTTGDKGKSLNPGHPLAGFQTDDGYLRYGLEIGWIGLILFLVVNYLILRTGAKAYFRTPNQRMKYVYAAAITALFTFMIAELAQEVIGQICCDVLIYPLIAMILRMSYEDNKEALAAPDAAAVPGL